MATKEDLSDNLNELLGTSVDFSKMSKEDLENLTNMLDEPGYLVQRGIKRFRKKATKEILERPLKELLDKSIVDDLKAGKGGPFGFGLLPSVLKVVNKRRSQR